MPGAEPTASSGHFWDGDGKSPTPVKDITAALANSATHPVLANHQQGLPN